MNADTNYGKILSDAIASNRKAAGMTQDALAEKLGITFQAVSKWENGLAMPDITLLPQIAAIFGISIDSLFGITPKTKIHTEKETASGRVLDWDDDEKLRAVFFIGNRIAGKEEEIQTKSTITFEYDGVVRDVISDFSVSCGDVEGDVTTANGAVTCGDVEGDITTSNGSIRCGDVDGGATTSNGSITCSDVAGNVATANGSITCGDVEGDVATANGKIRCGDVDGDVTIGDCRGNAAIECGNVGGDVSIKGNGTVTVSGDIDGNVTATTVIRKS